MTIYSSAGYVCSSAWISPTLALAGSLGLPYDGTILPIQSTSLTDSVKTNSSTHLDTDITLGSDAGGGDGDGSTVANGEVEMYCKTSVSDKNG